jgi:hypothetical protein
MKNECPKYKKKVQIKAHFFKKAFKKAVITAC